MARRPITAISIALIIAGSLATISPAQSFTELDCGSSPIGGSANHTDEYCEVEFPQAGEFEWSTPQDSSTLLLLLVGAGGGGSGRTEFGEGFAGGGADLIFRELSELVPNSEVSIFVGAGGVTNELFEMAGGDGENSWVEIASDRWEVSGGEGSQTFLWGYCEPLGISGFNGPGPRDSFRPGRGELYPDNSLPSGGTCESRAPGYIPSAENETPDVFSDISTEFAAGGDVIVNDEAAYAAGNGANVFITTEDTFYTVSLDESGSDGAVMFRWIPDAALADSGVDASAIGIGAGALLAGGVALGAVAAVRRARAKN
jgi:hypothetical protein